MFEAAHVTITGVVGDALWGVDTTNGNAVVWDQKRVSFRLPTQQEAMGAKAHASRATAERERLSRIARIIEQVDVRCMAADGPVTPTLQEMTQAEISEIYELANGGPALCEAVSSPPKQTPSVGTTK